MIVADKQNGRLYWVWLRCYNCAADTGTFNQTREECNNVLYLAGWRLYRRKQLCPTCAEKVAKRLRRRTARMTTAELEALAGGTKQQLQQWDEKDKA